MSAEIAFEAITYDGLSFEHDEDGKATTDQGKRLEQIGFTQRAVAHPRYDEVLVLDHRGPSGRVDPGRVVIVHDEDVLGVIDAPPEPEVVPDESWSKDDLLALAAEREVDGRTRMTKAELVEALT